MKKSTSHSRGFTLVEMLTVIAIIAVLAGLLFPAIKSALVRAEVGKAQQAANGLATALRAYHTEYGKWPIADSLPDQTYIVDAYFVRLLRGENVVTTDPVTVYPRPTVVNTPPTACGGNVNTPFFQGNSRGIVFHEFKQTDLNGSTIFVDPWGKPYYIRFDTDYDNHIPHPFLQCTPPCPPTTFPDPKWLDGSVLVWSDGPDGGEIIDVNGEYAPVNRDNVMSWR